MSWRNHRLASVSTLLGHVDQKGGGGSTKQPSYMTKVPVKEWGEEEKEEKKEDEGRRRRGRKRGDGGGGMGREEEGEKEEEEGEEWGIK